MDKEQPEMATQPVPDRKYVYITESESFSENIEMVLR